ncbi:hypothetical protein AURDEDRAFT_175696 [Auricularia subglabra TFB-10046 SS5]|nr:hypothetical protein AURDEDRAFT_175696 [Auricularia subglabra TFB-10046 SS5]
MDSMREQPPSTVHRPPSTVHRPPSTVHRPPSTNALVFPAGSAYGRDCGRRVTATPCSRAARVRHPRSSAARMVVIPMAAIRLWTSCDGHAMPVRRPSPPSPQQRRPHRTLVVL